MNSALSLPYLIGSVVILEFLSLSMSAMSIIISWYMIPVNIVGISHMSLESGLFIADCRLPDVAIAPTAGVQAITEATDIFLIHGFGFRNGV